MYQVKSDVDINDLAKMSWAMNRIFNFSNDWCISRKITPYWTSMYRPPNDGISVSRTHQEYRAFDLSAIDVFGWTDDLRTEYIGAMLKNFKQEGAMVKIECKLISRPVVLHGLGSALHFHIQTRPGLK